MVALFLSFVSILLEIAIFLISWNLGSAHTNFGSVISKLQECKRCGELLCINMNLQFWPENAPKAQFWGISGHPDIPPNYTRYVTDIYILLGLQSRIYCSDQFRPVWLWLFKKYDPSSSFQV